MKEPHSLFIFFLLLITLCAVAGLSMNGYAYYATGLEQRPFLPEHSSMKPSGTYSHGLGIFGALMIIVGVSVYSTRKRVRALWTLGKLSRWLEFHIVLCLLGPVLVIYHTTFKAGGIAAISLWTMLSVAASGIIGRFLYVLIPRNLNGNELTLEELNKSIQELASDLKSSAVGIQIADLLDKAFGNIQKPETLGQTVSMFFTLQRIKAQAEKDTRTLIKKSAVSPEYARPIIRIAHSRAVLLQKSLLLQQIERLFYYWHVIHLPFSIIMFITLAAHVAVSVWLGYTWIF